MSTAQNKKNLTRRRLGAFAISIALLFVLMGVLSTWMPRLGLDLRGGTTIQLTAKDAGGGRVNPDSLEMAKNIISQRVDSLGVGESSVTIQGDDQIEVSVPNMSGDELIDLVGSTARLNFRAVLAYAPAQSIEPVDTKHDAGEAKPGASESSAARRPAPKLPNDPPENWTPRPTAPAETMPSIDDRLAYQPSQQDAEEFQTFKCGMDFPDVVDQPLIACDETNQVKYLLSPMLVSGENLTDAKAGIPSGQLSWVVTLQLDQQGTSDFGKTSQALSAKKEPQNQFAIVLDSKVISAPRINGPILNGSAEISGGDMNEQNSKKLASTLRYGALPIDLEVSSVDTISPTLGGEQLKAGLIAGAIGLVLVMIYSVVYYRGLSFVVISSIAAAGLLTYQIIVLLGDIVGFALNLPGVAGIIVGIGMTADSFIVYFERIRDEVRQGHPLRSAIDSGWKKARGTIIMADSVQLLAAIVLYFLSMGSVKGFAFTLGVTTAIDLFMVVFFTHPLVSWLVKFKFFAQGHPWSGFSPDHMGVSKKSLLGRGYRAKEAAND